MALSKNPPVNALAVGTITTGYTHQCHEEQPETKPPPANSLEIQLIEPVVFLRRSERQRRRHDPLEGGVSHLAHRFAACWPGTL